MRRSINGSFFLGYVHHLDGLQRVAECDHQVAGLDHAPCLQKGEGAVQVAVHVVGEGEAEGDEAPLEVQPSPDGCRGCEGEDRAVGTATREQGGHVASLRENKDGINSQAISCRWKWVLFRLIFKANGF